MNFTYFKKGDPFTSD